MPEPHIYVAYWNDMSPTLYQSLVSNVFSDTQHFSRPRKLSDTFILDQVDARKIICSSQHTAQHTVLITNESLPFKGTTEVFAETKVHKFATVYDVQRLKDQPKVLAAYCGGY